MNDRKVILKIMYKFIIFGTGLFGRQALQFFGGGGKAVMLCSAQIITVNYMEI